ncbi:MAG: heavy metal-associated domain-containing protein [Candidatus Latescibacterota bacterium]
MIRVTIEGMSCQNCVRHVREALSRLPGVTRVQVSLERGEAEVEASGEVSDEAIRKALDEEGYQATAIARG